MERNKSCSHYSKHMDDITVLTNDCSYVEEYCGRRMALLRKNCGWRKKYIGFRIFGIRHFMLECQVDLSGRKRVEAILKKMMQLCPGSEFPEKKKQMMLKLLKRKCFYVDVPATK